MSQNRKQDWLILGFKIAESHNLGKVKSKFCSPFTCHSKWLLGVGLPKNVIKV